jgi:hypothetical protein
LILRQRGHGSLRGGFSKVVWPGVRWTGCFHVELVESVSPVDWADAAFLFCFAKGRLASHG